MGAGTRSWWPSEPLLQPSSREHSLPQLQHASSAENRNMLPVLGSDPNSARAQRSETIPVRIPGPHSTPGPGRPSPRGLPTSPTAQLTALMLSVTLSALEAPAPKKPIQWNE